MKIASNGRSAIFGGLRTPMGKASNGLIKKGSMKPKIAANTICPTESTAAAKVRSAQTGGKVVKPF